MIVSIFKKVTDVNTPFQKNVYYALERIRNGKSKTIIDKLRTMSEDDYQKNKSLLPGVCFNGKFRNRSANALLQHSGLIILDFDKFTTEDDAKNFRDSILSDEFVFSCWISPSGKGVKVLVKIPPKPENHKAYFLALKKHYPSDNWDDSGKDVSRFCFESYDPDLYLNENSTIWTEIDEPEIDDIGSSRDNVTIPMTSTNQIIQILLVWFGKKYGKTKGSRHSHLYLLANTFNDFVVPKDEALFECLKFQQDDFTSKEIESIVNHAYTRESANKCFEDIATKEKVEKQLRSGKNKKEVQKLFPNVDISKVRENLDIDEFWYYNEKGKICLSTHKYKFWLEQNNLFKFYPSESSTTFTFIKKEQNLLEETNDKRIKDFVLTEILNRENIGFGPYDFMAGSTGFFKSDFLSMLATTNINLKEDNKDECFIYYKNCVVKVTKDSVEEIDYIDVDGYVWRRQIIDREFKKFDHHSAVFRTFLWLTSGKNVQKYNSFKSVIGYLLHSYKTSANNKAIIFNDETISENPNGGSGKGLFWNALSHMKKVTPLDGKSFEFSKSFPYQTVSTDTQILVFDDVKKNFSFESLFSLITEGITLEYKGQDAIKIPVSKSPKILITTNYTIGGIGGSFERRKFEVEMSDYFSYKHTPVDEFGHMLFDDWDSDEWHRFDNFMINCEQYYLQNGLVKHDFHNLEVRKFIKETSFEFYEWSKEDGNIRFNIRCPKSSLFESFLAEYPDFRVFKLSQKRFKMWMEQFAKYYGYTYKDGNTNGERWFEIQAENKDLDSEDIPF